MNAALLAGARQIQLSPCEEVSPGPGEITLKVRVALASEIDLHGWRTGQARSWGHSAACEVAELGEGVEGLRPGQPILAALGTPRGSSGGFRARLGLPADPATLLPRPEGMSDLQAALLDPLARACEAARRLALTPSDTILVLGDGLPSLVLTAWLTRARGHRRLLAGVGSARIERALEAGAGQVFSLEDPDWAAQVRAATGGHGPEVIVEGTGRPTLVEAASELIGKGSQLLLWGAPPEQALVSLDTYRLHYDQIALIGCRGASPAALAQALEGLPDLNLPLARWLEPAAPLSRIREVLASLEDDPSRIHPILTQEPPQP